MKNKGQIAVMIILCLVVMVAIITFFFLFRANIGLHITTSYAILELPKSSSQILSNLTNKTYLMDEEVYATIRFNKKEIKEIINLTVEDTEINKSEIMNYSFYFPLDTLINNGNPTQTKILSIHGLVISQNDNEEPFSITKNYEVVSSKEELLLKISGDNLEISQKANTISEKANIIAIISGIIALISLIFSVYCWIKSKKQEKIISKLVLKINLMNSKQKSKRRNS